MSGTFFDKESVMQGLYIAMEFGAPNAVSDRATFYMPRSSTVSGNTNDKGVPFNPSSHQTFSPLVKKVVPCAVEYFDTRGKVMDLGMLIPSKIKLTILGPDFLKIQGFEYVVISGLRFFYSHREPVIGMGGIDVYTVYARSEDEA